MEIRLLTLANREVDDAVRWYEAREQGLSRHFLDELDRVVRLIRRHPLAGVQIETEIRRFPLALFPTR